MCTLIANSGIQYLTLNKTLSIDAGAKIIGAQYFYERQIGEVIKLEPVVYFPNKNVYVTRTELQYMGYYVDLKNNVLVDESQINFSQLTLLPDTDVVSVSNLMTVLNRIKLLDKMENVWLPIPMYDNDAYGVADTPTNWCRLKLIPLSNKGNVRDYKVVLAFDTTTSLESGEALNFQGESVKRFSLCGVGNDVLENLCSQNGKQNEYKVMCERTIPMICYSFCDIAKRPWIDEYLRDLFFGWGFDIADLPPKNRLKYLVFYIYAIAALKSLRVIPDVKVFSDSNSNTVDTALVVDVGNSRTYGLVSEIPVNSSFSNVAQLEMCDLENGNKYAEPFDMRLAFKKEIFGGASRFVSKQFAWPSVVRLGKEAQRLIYEEEEKTENVGTAYSYYSSPKRFLWDDKCYNEQWEYISTKSAYAGGVSRIDLEGVVQQFREDGSFAQDPKDMGVMSTYSRRSLMTFCFMEIILQARMQVNSVEFREKNGREDYKRVIKEIIITCPTAMARQEQIALRRAALEACVVIDRYYRNSYMKPCDLDLNNPIVKIYPSIRDLMLTNDKIENKRTWNFDEATCCQMVYMFAESKRYNGKINKFLDLYSKKAGKPLVVGSLDIGAGTSDMMICSYASDVDDNVLTPTPMFGESFTYAGDDILKGIIREVVIETNNEGTPGVISKKIHQLNPLKAADIMNMFFTDPSAMGLLHRKMRSKFNVQVSIPIAQKYLELLRTGHENCTLSYDDIFTDVKPASNVLNYFRQYFGFGVEDLTFPFEKEVVNGIIRKDIKRHIEKWMAIFASYKCDILLLGGRPCSLPVIENLVKQSYTVAPNRLISMNNYRVGNWYPGSDGLGHFGDRKSLVAVGALIADLASKGLMPGFKLNVSKLILTDMSVANYLLTDKLGEPFISVETNYNTIYVRSLPVYIYAKQINVDGFPDKTLYKLDIDEKSIRKSVQSNLIPNLNVDEETENIIARIRNNPQLEFSFERDYYTDKEILKIDSVFDSNGTPISKNSFILHQQSVDDEGLHWMDSGIFKVNIN